MSIGKCASCCPRATSIAALLIAVAMSGSSTPSSALARAAAALIRASARMCADSRAGPRWGSSRPHAGSGHAHKRVARHLHLAHGVVLDPELAVARVSHAATLRRSAQSVGSLALLLQVAALPLRVEPPSLRCLRRLGRATRTVVAARSLHGWSGPSVLRPLRGCEAAIDAPARRSVRMPSTRRLPSLRTARSRMNGVRAEVCATSKLNSARESLVLTDCPPGPLDREKRQVSSRSGMTSPERITRSPGMASVCYAAEEQVVRGGALTEDHRDRPLLGGARTPPASWPVVRAHVSADQTAVTPPGRVRSAHMVRKAAR